MKKLFSNIIKTLANEFIILFSIKNILKFCRDDDTHALFKHCYVLRGPKANKGTKIITANQIDKNFNRAVKHSIKCSCINSAFKNIFILGTDEKKYKVQNLIDKIYWQDEECNSLYLQDLAASPADYIRYFKSNNEKRKYLKNKNALSKIYSLNIMIERFRTHAIEHKLAKFAPNAKMISYIIYDIDYFTTSRIITIFYNSEDSETVQNIVYNRKPQEEGELS